jgi:hypothetical protein
LIRLPHADYGYVIALQTGAVDLTNYESLTWQFPTEGRPEKVSYTLRAQLSALQEPASAGHAPELAKALAESAKIIDYVLLVGEEGPDWLPAEGRSDVFDLLFQTGYKLVAQDGSPAFIRVFARR